MQTRLLPVLSCLLWMLLVAAPLHAGQGVTENYGPVVAEIVKNGDQAIQEYAPARSTETGALLSRLYYGIFETSGMEFTLNLKNRAHMLKIESGFSQVISQAMRGASKADVERAWQGLRGDLEYAAAHYSSGEKEQGFWGRALQSFLILFREGVEAMLVVAALVAYLRRSGYADKVRVIWQAVGWALLASVGAAWVLHGALQASGASREALEGLTMLLAAGVLVYVSYWLTSKRDADRWQAFIRERMDQAVGRGSHFALGLVAFLAVFREGAETILFYQALMAGSPGRMDAIWSGMALAVAGLTVVYLLVNLASLRLPVGLFFRGTAVLLFAMALVFTGQGLLELQVSGLIRATRLEGWPMFSWLGIFPTLETVVGQGLVLALLPLGWLLLQRAGRPQSAGDATP